MKYLIILSLMVSTLLAKNDSSFDLISSLDKSYEAHKDKIVLDYLPEHVKNNLKYLVSPHMRNYVSKYHDVLNSIKSADDNYDSILTPGSKFDTFLFGITTIVEALKNKQELSENQSNALYSLQRAQLSVLKLILQDVQNLSQLQFIITHLDVFLLFAVDVNDTKSCEIINLYRYDEALFEFMILLDDGEYRNDNNTTGDVLDVFNNTLLAKEDRNMKTYDFISQESSKIIEKENDIFLKNVREEFNPPLFLNGLDSFPFLDGYVNKINERKKELEELEKKYEKNPVGLAELQKLYSEIFANMANLYSTEIFQQILKMHNKLVKMKKECANSNIKCNFHLKLTS